MTAQAERRWAEKASVLGAEDMERVLRRIAVEIVERNKGLERVILLGIQRRGVYLAARLREMMKEAEKVKVPTGELDITLYRDDISVLADQPVVHSTSVPGDITGKRWFSWTMSFSQAGRYGLHWTPSRTSEGPSGFSLPCWWTGDTGSCPSRPITWGRRSPRPGRRTWKSA